MLSHSSALSLTTRSFGLPDWGRLFLACAVFSLPLSLISKAAAEEKVLVFGTYNYVKELNLERFYPLLLLERAMSRQGYGVELRLLPGKRSIANAHMGLLDGEFSRGPGIEKTYTNLVPVAEPFFTMCFSLYRKQHQQQSLDPDRAISNSIGVIRGMPSVEKAIYQRWPKAWLVQLKDFKQGALLLARGRVDYIVAPDIMRQYLNDIVKKGIVRNRIVKASTPIWQNETYVYFHRKHAGLAQSTAEALREVKKEFLPAKGGCVVENYL